MATNNPLFNQEENLGGKQKESQDYVLGPSSKKNIMPTKDMQGRQAATNIIRDKLTAIYKEEPGVKAELSELAEASKPLSKHQKALSDIQDKAKSVAEIQTKWHEYYVSLPDKEKQEVWQEFYKEQARHSRYAQFMARPAEKQPDDTKIPVVSNHEPATSSASHKRLRDARTAREIKNGIREKVAASNQSQKPNPLHSLWFGLATGAIVLLIMLFGLFNQLIIAPFIQPSRNVSATPIILDNSSIAADGTSKIIIPKINVEIPLDFGVESLVEEDIQKGLESGIVHYPTTVLPGQQGNGAYFGHSSNNLFNPGKYKYAFVLLNNLQAGDMFYITYEKKVYAYRVYDKKVVNPNEVWILNAVKDKTATAALITCDPPGTTLKRLVVWGEQITPDPAGNTASQSQDNTATAQELPGTAPSLWKRLLGL